MSVQKFELHPQDNPCLEPDCEWNWDLLWEGRPHEGLSHPYKPSKSSDSGKRNGTGEGKVPGFDSAPRGPPILSEDVPLSSKSAREIADCKSRAEAPNPDSVSAIGAQRGTGTPASKWADTPSPTTEWDPTKGCVACERFAKAPPYVHSGVENLLVHHDVIKEKDTELARLRAELAELRRCLEDLLRAPNLQNYWDNARRALEGGRKSDYDPVHAKKAFAPATRADLERIVTEQNREIQKLREKNDKLSSLLEGFGRHSHDPRQEYPGCSECQERKARRHE